MQGDVGTKALQNQRAATVGGNILRGEQVAAVSAGSGRRQCRRWGGVGSWVASGA